jgi:hypothetical protein
MLTVVPITLTASLKRYIENDMPSFIPSNFMANDAPKISNAFKRMWLEDEVLIYLCAFHIIKTWKNHIILKVLDLENLHDLVYRALHKFLTLLLSIKKRSQACSNDW